MKHRLVKLSKFSGDKASVYAVLDLTTGKTSFDDFITNNKILFKDEIKDIQLRLYIIGHKTGAREEFFKLNEGVLGDGVCALYDSPDMNLRLYCIRYGKGLIITGGGGEKPKSMREFQESDILTDENFFLRELSQRVTERTKDRDILFTNDGMDLKGDLEFNDDEDE